MAQKRSRVNPNWPKGLSLNPYSFAKKSKVQKKVKKQTNSFQQKNKTQEGKQLQTHHTQHGYKHLKNNLDNYETVASRSYLTEKLTELG